MTTTGMFYLHEKKCSEPISEFDLLIQRKKIVMGPMIIATLILMVALSIATYVDLMHMRLPNWVTLPLIPVGLAIVYVSNTQSDLWLHASAAVLAYLAFWLVAKTYRRVRNAEGLGLGDAKLFAAVGAWLGPWFLAPVVLLSTLLALTVVLVLRLRGEAVDSRTIMPFGPFLSVAFFSFWCAKEFGGFSFQL